jgi:hypothetical protein
VRAGCSAIAKHPLGLHPNEETYSFTNPNITAQGWRRAAKKMTSGFVTDKRIEGGLSVYTAPAVGAGVRFLSAGHYPQTESCLTLRCNTKDAKFHSVFLAIFASFAVQKERCHG